MQDIRETAIDHLQGDETITLSSSEQKFVKMVRDLKNNHPDEVDILAENKDGSIVAKLPASWLKIKPKIERKMTAEQIAASKARLEKGRQKRLLMLGDENKKGELTE